MCVCVCMPQDPLGEVTLSISRLGDGAWHEFEAPLHEVKLDAVEQALAATDGEHEGKGAGAGEDVGPVMDADVHSTRADPKLARKLAMRARLQELGSVTLRMRLELQPVRVPLVQHSVCAWMWLKQFSSGTPHVAPWHSRMLHRNWRWWRTTSLTLSPTLRNLLSM